MAVQFPANKYAQIAAPWLDNVTKMSVYCRVRFDTVTAGAKQYLFQHRLGTTGDQLSLRKDSATGDKLKASITVGGNVSGPTGSTTIVAGTVYDLVLNWQGNVATDGTVLYLNGVEEARDNSTTDQTVAYNTAGGSLYIASRSGPGEYGLCTLERFMVFPGMILSQAQIDSLRFGAWPHQLGLQDNLACFYPMFAAQVTRLVDLSGSQRHIEASGITGPLTAVQGLGLVQDPAAFWAGALTAPVSAGPSPNPWIDVTPDVPEDQQSLVISGLVNGTTYQFKVRAKDDTGNILDLDAVPTVEATPTAVTAADTAAPWRRGRFLTKYRKGAQ